MSRYKDEQCRICRREGQKLFLKGSRCYTDKCSVTRRNYAPGEHGQGKKKLSEYGTQLREKQKTKAFYGVGEKQFRKYFEMAENKKGITPLTNVLGKPSPLKKKFRIWRTNIPRDISNNMDRMRNPWLYIKLSMENENINKTLLHDMIVYYYE